ncbi:rhodanese-like domain-containing protein [Candidatus Kinetoplastidibacterium galati]|uniref:Rhodanese-related sulfurtransferase n=1 Tax=Candidatus Kinetoplastidibacterium galati TCC219 TaxID=1208921 RepID=M1L9Y5_9PROT|nr:rhodanese-like domain-containing protein [Candidatus Kinetoplastibacterium galatii]AGF49333.1 Rhodanese-related sulfurtransferase [Candidatus Kinetoplastibacterium galatii TCC219]
MDIVNFFIKDNNILFLFIAIISAIMLLMPYLRKNINGIELNEAINLVNKNEAILADIRTPNEFKEKHIPQSYNTNSDDLKSNNKFTNKPVILICKDGTDSSKLASEIKNHSTGNVLFLIGGMNEWISNELPIIKK